MPMGSVNAEALRWWTGQDDAVLWRQLPPAELPKAHFVNAHQGCPSCGTAIFTHGGFYPWKRRHLPRVSEGALVLLRALDRPDVQEVMTWLYERGPDKLRVFGINDFFPDGTPPESTGGYNNIHSNGLFVLEYHLRHWRDLYPQAYAETEFPSLMADPRAARVALAPHEITALGKAFIQLGDGIKGLAAGERIRINPAGRGHNYRIEEVEELEPGRHRIKLDVTTLLGNLRVVAIDGMQVELDFHIMARSGNLHGTRLQAGEEWAEIIEAHNPDTNRTVVVLQETVKGLKIGDWASVVDCVVGDEVVYEPLCRSEW
jgi:hypothetical protein